MLAVLDLDPVLLSACVAKHRAAISLPNLRRSCFWTGLTVVTATSVMDVTVLPMSGNQFDG
jgi:hypothetical protein